MRNARVLVASLGVLCAGAAAQDVGLIVEVPSRPGITQQALVEPTRNPQAVALLFAGGNGGVRFGAQGTVESFKGNFLLRARTYFREHGVVPVVVGTPSDRRAEPFLDNAFRGSAEHAQDIAALADDMKKRFGVPVWLVGTSRGTLSAAAIALSLGAAKFDGLVLTATMASVADMPVERMAVPTLLVHHTRDSCRVTDFRDLRWLQGKLKAPRSELLTFSGGNNEGPACEAFAYHGFNGIEKEVIAAIANWMLAR